MTKSDEQNLDITAESKRLQLIETLISRFQEVQTVRDFAVSRCCRSEIDNIDRVFTPLLDSILQEIETHIDQYGPLNEKAFLQHQDDGDGNKKVAA